MNRERLRVKISSPGDFAASPTKPSDLREHRDPSVIEFEIPWWVDNETATAIRQKLALNSLVMVVQEEQPPVRFLGVQFVPPLSSFLTMIFVLASFLPLCSNLFMCCMVVVFGLLMSYYCRNLWAVG